MVRTKDEIFIRGLINEAIGTGEGKQDFQQVLASIKSHGEPVYHRPMDAKGSDSMAIIKSLFRRGFSREYTGDNGGNMYGAGVYNVYELRSSNEKASGYGRFIVQSYVVDGFRDFLIFNSDIAKKYYGDRWSVKDQLYYLIPMKQEADRVVRSIEGRFGDLRHLMNNYHNQDYKKTSAVAWEVTKMLDMSATKIRGIIYSGGHDGCCAFVRDFTDVIPWAWSSDNGRSWKIGVNEAEVNHLLGSIDTDFELKGRVDKEGRKQYDDVARKSINGYALVYKGTKVNYYSVKERKLISNVWFDEAFNFEEDGEAEVLYKGVPLILRYEDGQYNVYDEDGFDVCELNELPNVIK